MSDDLSMKYLVVENIMAQKNGVVHGVLPYPFWRKLISIDEAYIPDAAGQAEAWDVLATYLPQASSIQVRASKHIESIDAGANFESISCPNCGTQLEVEWWQDAMDRVAETRFENLTVLTPCCETKLSLNDLNYQFPGGFARFVLSADNPQADLEAGFFIADHLFEAILTEAGEQ